MQPFPVITYANISTIHYRIHNPYPPSNALIPIQYLSLTISSFVYTHLLSPFIGISSFFSTITPFINSLSIPIHHSLCLSSLPRPSLGLHARRQASPRPSGFLHWLQVLANRSVTCSKRPCHNLVSIYLSD